MGKTKTELLLKAVRHFDIKQFDCVSLMNEMQHTAFQAKNLVRIAKIDDQRLLDGNYGVILSLAGSLMSASLRSSSNMTNVRAK